MRKSDDLLIQCHKVNFSGNSRTKDSHDLKAVSLTTRLLLIAFFCLFNQTKYSSEFSYKPFFFNFNKK